MSNNLRPAVKALIEEEGRILTLKTSAQGEIYWVLPGGKVEYGETPIETLKREIKEELSAEIEIGDAVGMYHFFIGSKNEGDQVVLTVFEGNIGNQDIDISDNPANEGITEFKWLKPKELIQKSSNESLQKLIAEKYGVNL